MNMKFISIAWSLINGKVVALEKDILNTAKNENFHHMEQFSFSGMLNWSINVTFSIFALAQAWQGIYGKLTHHLR